MSYNITRDTYTCDSCGFEDVWEANDDLHGELWECEKCGNNFCSKCFIDKFGEKEFLNMMENSNKVCCPSCWEKQKEVVAVVPELMRIDTEKQTINMQQIDNRRFLFNPKTGVLVLGRQYKCKNCIVSSHAEELADAGITKDFDIFVRGWIGTGKDYPKGVIHFAPCVDPKCISLFERAYDTLEMFAENGALPGTIVRGFGKQWEQPLSSIAKRSSSQAAG